MKHAVVLVVCLHLAVVSGSSHGDDRSWDSIRTKYQPRSLAKCLDQGDFICIKAKLITNLNKVLQSRQFHFFDGVSVQKLPRNGEVDFGRALTDRELDFANIPDENVDARLDQLLLAGVSRLFQNRAVKLDFVPGFGLSITRNQKDDGLVNVDLERTSSSPSEGRGEKKGGVGFLVVGFMMKAALAVLAVAALKALAFKALLVGKISLVLSGLQLVKNLLGKGAEQSQVVYGHRSLPEDAHGMAYGGQTPTS